MKELINIIKRVLNIKLIIFNRKTKNSIHSRNVCIDSIKGNGIEVMDRTFIDADSEIHSFTYIGLNCFITKAKIGRFTSIANNVSIGMGEHQLDRISTSSIFYENPYEELTAKECIIGNDVWIGVDSIIRRGVTIGNGAVIGANSVVTNDVPDFAIAVGSPARVIRYRFNPEKIAAIYETKWWEKELNQAKELIKSIENRFSENKK